MNVVISHLWNCVQSTLTASGDRAIRLRPRIRPPLQSHLTRPLQQSVARPPSSSPPEPEGAENKGNPARVRHLAHLHRPGGMMDRAGFLISVPTQPAGCWTYPKQPMEITMPRKNPKAIRTAKAKTASLKAAMKTGGAKKAKAAAKGKSR